MTRFLCCNLLLGSLFLLPVLGQGSQVAESPAPPAALEVGSATWATLVDGWATPLVHDGLVMGLCVGVLQGDQVWTRGYGRLAATREGAPDQDTIYEIGSISKVFTGVLLADAVERGEIRLDEPIQETLPAEVVLGKRKAPVRWVNLANHTSGWARMPDNFGVDPDSLVDPYAAYGTKELFDFLKGYRGLREPGKRYAYSNLAVGTLGVLLERRLGSDYATLIAQRITGPLGMVSTGLSIPEGAASREAAPYDVSLDPDSLWHFQAMVSAGGIRSSVRDMLRLAQATVAAPEGVLGAALELSMRPTFEVDETLSMGLGWHRNPQLGLVWHNGQTGGFHSYLCVCPSEDLAVVVLCNTASGLVDQLGSNLMAELRGQATRPWDYEAEHPQPRERLAGLVGTYDLAPGVKVEVTLDERGLLGQLTGQPAVRLLASDADHFFLRVVDARVTFERDADGRGMALILHQGGRDQRAPRRESAPESK